MNNRHIARVINAIDSEDGAGVKLKRSIGRSQSLRIDPFLMLDAFSSDNPDDYIAGFPPHPHRGFETVTYMLDGHMVHRDHMGNEGDLRAGGVQWMTAGRGVVHEERPQQVDGLMRGFQLWINLPAKEKMKAAAYQNIEPEAVPRLEAAPGVTVSLVAGDIEVNRHKIHGPIQAESTEPLYLDVTMQPGSTFTLPIKHSHNAFIYLFEGAAEVADESLMINSASELSAGDAVTITTGQDTARMLILAGKPLNEPVAQYGPFVMNTMEEVEQAIQDYRAGTLTEA